MGINKGTEHSSPFVFFLRCRVMFKVEESAEMKGYKIDFDLGEIAYFEDHDLIQVYRFHSFYSRLRLE